MYNNLIAEMIKKGYKAKDIASILANLLDCSEKTIESKLKNIQEFTFSEVMKINKQIFDNKMDLKYLFATKSYDNTTYHKQFIQKTPPSKWWNQNHNL